MKLKELKEELENILEEQLDLADSLSIGVESKLMTLNYFTIEVGEAHVNDDYFCIYTYEDTEICIPFTEDMEIIKEDEGDGCASCQIVGKNITVYMDFI